MGDIGLPERENPSLASANPNTDKSCIGHIVKNCGLRIQMKYNTSSSCAAGIYIYIQKLN